MFLVCQSTQIDFIFDIAFVYYYWNFFCGQGMEQVKPFTVSVWCGDSKPSNLNEFLYEFVNELNDILANGIHVNGFFIEVGVHCFIADSPARAFLKGICNNR